MSLGQLAMTTIFTTRSDHAPALGQEWY